MHEASHTVEADDRPDHRIVGPTVVRDLDIRRERTQNALGRIAESIPTGLRELETLPIVCIADDAPPS